MGTATLKQRWLTSRGPSMMPDMIVQMTDEMDIDPDTIDETEIIEPNLANDPLNVLAHAFTTEAHRCLETIQPSITNGTREAFEDLKWYYTPLTSKQTALQFYSMVVLSRMPLLQQPWP